MGWGGVGWGGVGCGGGVGVPSTAFLRPSQDVDATLHVPSALHTMLMLQPTLTWGGVGWGGDVNVPSRSFGLAQDVDATLGVPSALHTMWMLQMLMLRSHGVGVGGVGWGRVGMLAFLHAPSTLHKMFMLHYAFPRPCAGC